MVALIALLLILAIFGGLGFAAHILWIVLIIALVLWVIGFLVGLGARYGRGTRRHERADGLATAAAGVCRRSADAGAVATGATTARPASARRRRARRSPIG
jgi:energy-coupling factor transporter transmembrane protein EcfT